MRGAGWRGGYLVYGLPAFALAVPTIPAHVLLPSYYATDLGVGLSATGIAVFAARAIDVVSDPLIGHASDRMGRRKPFIAGGAALAAIALLALFAPPAGVGALYLGVWYAILYTAWSAAMVPYSAWGAELSEDYAARARLAAWREGLGLAGIALATMLPAVLQWQGRGQGESMLATALLAIAVGLPSLALLLAWVPEVRAVDSNRSGSLRAALAAAAANAPFRRLLGSWFLNGIANGLPAALFPLFVTVRLGIGEAELGLTLLIYFAAAIGSLPIWLWLLKRIDKHRLWCLAMLAALAAFIWVPLLPEGALLSFVAISVVTGMALGADLALPPAIQADLAGQDRQRTGQDRTGLFFALSTMSSKLSAALAVGVAFPLLGYLGFDPGDGHAEALPVAVIYAWVPCVFKAIAVTLMWRFPLDRHCLVPKG